MAQLGLFAAAQKAKTAKKRARKADTEAKQAARKAEQARRAADAAAKKHAMVKVRAHERRRPKRKK